MLDKSRNAIKGPKMAPNQFNRFLNMFMEVQSWGAQNIMTSEKINSDPIVFNQGKRKYAMVIISSKSSV